VKSSLLLIYTLLSTFLCSHAAFAETIEFPEEELATESVLPVFDNPVSVKSRNVQTTKRFELGPQIGSHVSEPFYNPLNFGGTGTYHIDEIHGVNFFATVFGSGLQESGKSLKNIQGVSNKINLEYGPHTQWMSLISYQHNAFYGKISLTKEAVMNLSLYGLAGIGAVNIGGKVFPAATVGLGQNFYITKSLALRLDMRFLVYQGPNVAGGPNNPLIDATADVPVDQFQKRMFISSLLSGGVTWLIPNS
jgi:outer membrane beta-barrel protein